MGSCFIVLPWCRSKVFMEIEHRAYYELRPGSVEVTAPPAEVSQAANRRKTRSFLELLLAENSSLQLVSTFRPPEYQSDTFLYTTAAHWVVFLFFLF